MNTLREISDRSGVPIKDIARAVLETDLTEYPEIAEIEFFEAKTVIGDSLQTLYKICAEHNEKPKVTLANTD